MNLHTAILTAIHKHLQINPDYTTKLEHDNHNQELIRIDHPLILSTEITIENDYLEISDYDCHLHHIPLADPELIPKTQQLITQLTTQALDQLRPLINL